MKKILKGISAVICGLALVAINVNVAYAWGPERATFTMKKPATYPTFNSITDNPTIGDERNFVRIAEKGVGATYADEVKVEPGKEYEVYIYFHNNASETYNSEEHNRSGIALQTRLSSAFSTVVTPEKKGAVTATISAKNANPAKVWDDAYMVATQSVRLHYLEGSAKILNDWKANGSVVSTAMFSEEGTYIGLNKLDGVVPGCEQYHGVVVYTLVAEKLGMELEKTVSLDGQNYGEEVEAKAGTEVFFKITLKNVGNTALENVTVKDLLPDKMELVKGSVQLLVNDEATPVALSDALTDKGYNLGKIGVGKSATIKFKAKMGEKYDCDVTSLENVAQLNYDGSGEKIKDGAKVKVVHGGECLPATPDKPKELPETGPAEIIMAVVVVLGIGGAGYYLYRTKRTLKVVEGAATGKMDGGNGGSQEPDNMVE